MRTLPWLQPIDPAGAPPVRPGGAALVGQAPDVAWGRKSGGGSAQVLFNVASITPCSIYQTACYIVQ